jgi:membrane-bound serine protease (ClpP class)
MIDDGLYRSIRRRTQLAIEQGADYVVYEIGTYGGLVQAADDISKYLILEAGKNLHTVAYVVTEAISAGAMVSVSCKDIVMRHSTTIGDCAPITLGGKLEGVEREKAESFIRAAFMRAAEANNYPPALLKAMVSLRMKVYRVKNLQTNQDEFFEEEELPADPNKYDLTNKQLVVSSDEILTLTAAQAYEYHIARALVDDLDGVFAFLGGRDGVAFAEKIPRLQPNWSEQMVRWLNSPVVFGILFMIALLGVYVEFNTPGVGLPGLVAVICFAIIFGSKYLVGMADWIEIALFAVGALLLAVEIFVLPGFGVAGVLGIMFMLAGLLGILVPQNIPWPRSDFDWKLFTNGAIALSSGFVAFLLLAYVLSRFIPRLEFFSGLILAPAEAKQGTEFEVSYTAPAQNGQVQLKVGDIGEVLTPLRPAGTARFASAVVDVVAEAAFLEGGTRVIIMAIHGNKVVVRKMESQ